MAAYSKLPELPSDNAKILFVQNNIAVFYIQPTNAGVYFCVF